MKKKSDFITNSSSCSFIFVGWSVDKKENTVKEMMEKFGIKKWDPELSEWENLYEVYNGDVSIEAGNEENGLSEDKVYIGYYKENHDDNYDTEEIPLKYVLKMKDKVGDEFNVEDIVIATGTAAC